MLQNTISKYMKHGSHDQNIKYFVSFVDEMVSDSEKDEFNKKILLDLAESFLKRLLAFYENEKFNCLVGYVYQRLGWIKFYKEKYRKAEKMFLYSIVNLKDCKYCTQELLESYMGLTRTYLMSNSPKKAKRYLLIAYNIMITKNTVYIEEDIEMLFNKLGITIEDLLRKK